MVLATIAKPRGAMEAVRHHHRHYARSPLCRVRRVALASLLLGWSAFWLLTVLQPCCQLARVHDAAAVVALAHSAPAAEHDGHHHPSAPADSCGSLTAVAVAAVAVAPLSGVGETATYGANPHALLHVHATPWVLTAADFYPPLPPPRAVAAFHQRTSRILI